MSHTPIGIAKLWNAGGSGRHISVEWDREPAGNTVLYSAEDYNALAEVNADLLKALEAMTEHYVSLINCGDCGNWNPEAEAPMIQARAALAKARGEKV